MAEGGVVIHGLREGRENVEQLPATASAELRVVALTTAARIKDGYQQRLRSQTHGTGRTADSARILDEWEERQITVNVPGHPDKPANLPMWLEYGTRYMTAKPSLRPAGDAENERFKQAVTTVYERLLQGLF